MSVLSLQPGDTVLAGRDIFNDGSFPNSEEGELLVPQGTRGMIVNLGYLEENEDQTIFLVQFETRTRPTVATQKSHIKLGPPIGCWPDDLNCLPVD